MKKFILFLFVAAPVFFTGAIAQVFQVDTLYKAGPLENRVNVVILGDGFTQAELPKFTAEARKFSNFFLSYAPYSHYRNYFNFFAIGTPSRESGVTNPGTASDVYKEQPVETKDTFYGSSFGGSIHRLVTVTKYQALSNVLATNFPAYDLVVILVNTTWYGGSGGSFAVVTLHDLANTIGVHEIGHTFTHLNDEYWAGPIYGWEAPNMTANSNPSTIKWKNWLNTKNVNVYPHGTGEAARWFKPTNSNCLMELLDKQFCNVCLEATSESIMSIVNPLEKTLPATQNPVSLSEADRTFSLDLVKTIPNSFQVEWTLDGKLVASGSDKITLSGSKLQGLTGLLTATIFDSTSLSRVNSARDTRTRSVSWNLVKSNEPAAFKLSAGTEGICPGQASVLTGSGCAGVITWSTGENGNSITVKPAQSTDYSASCRIDETTTVSRTAKIVVLPVPVALAGNAGPYFEGATIRLTADGGNSYQWTGPAQFISQLQNPTITGASIVNSGVYEVKVSALNGCTSLAQTNVKVDPVLSVKPGMEDLVVIAPNPAKDYIGIRTALPGRSEFELFDMRGRKILNRSFTQDTSVRVDGLTAGIYLYHFTNGLKETTGKVVIE